MAKTASPDPYSPGHSLTYTVSVTNSGPSDATGITVADPLPAALAGAGFAWTCTPSRGADCTATGSGDIHDAVSIPTGGRVVYSLSGTVPAAVSGTLTNTAIAAPAPGVHDPSCTPDCSATDTDPQAAPAVTLKTTATVTPATDQNAARLGDSISYSFEVTNAGNIPLKSVAVSDPEGGAVTCPAPPAPGLAPGATETCTGDTPHAVNQTDVNAGRVTDTATATGTDVDGQTSPASEPSTVTVITAASLGTQPSATESSHPAQIITDLGPSHGLPSSSPSHTSSWFTYRLGIGEILFLGVVGTGVLIRRRPRPRPVVGSEPSRRRAKLTLTTSVSITVAAAGLAIAMASTSPAPSAGATRARPAHLPPTSSTNRFYFRPTNRLALPGQPSAPSATPGGDGRGRAATASILVIPRLGVNAPILAEGIDRTPGDAGNLAIPNDVRDAGWWDGGPAPGQPGTTVLASHRAQGGVFWALPDLRPGDTIEVTLADGHTTEWTVTGVQQFLKADLPDSVWDNAGLPKLALITCGGPFNTSTGHYNDNIIVWAAPAPA